MRSLTACFVSLLVASALAACSGKVSTGQGGSGSPGSSGGTTPCDTPAGVTTTLVSGSYAYSLAVDSSYVYLASSQGVLRVPLTGGTPQPLTGSQDAYAVAVDSSHVYFTGDYSTGGSPKSGSATGLFSAPIGGGTPTLLASAWAMQIVVDDTNVYGAIGGLWAVPIGGGAQTTLSSKVQPSIPAQIAVYAGNVYVPTSPLGGAGITAVPTAGGSPQVLVSNRAMPVAVAVDASGIYWGEYSYQSLAGGIFRAGLDGSNVTQLATDDDVSGFAIDDTNVYWSAQHLDVVRSVPKAGGSTTTLATGLDGPAGLVAQGGNVYWAEQPYVDASLGGEGEGGVSGGSPATSVTVMTACK
jgi:hypothetical protein